MIMSYDYGDKQELWPLSRNYTYYILATTFQGWPKNLGNLSSEA